MTAPQKYPDVEPITVAALLRRRYGLDLVKCPRRLGGGLDNLNLRVATNRGEFVLRRYDVCGRGRAMQELRLVRALAKKGYPTPDAVPTTKGTSLSSLYGRPAALFPFVAGTVPPRYDPLLAEQMGRLLAQLHSITSTLRIALRGTSELRDLDKVVEFRNRVRLSDFRRVRAEGSRFLRQHRVRLRTAQGTLPGGAIHHDFHRFNLLRNRAGGAPAVVDFGEACVSPFVFDIARTYFYFASEARGHQLSESLQHAFMRGYESSRRLSREEVDLLPLAFDFVSLGDAARFLTAPGCAVDSIEQCRSWMIYRANRSDG